MTLTPSSFPCSCVIPLLLSVTIAILPITYNPLIRFGRKTCYSEKTAVSVHENGKLPVVNFAAGGVATPADAALMMQLGAEGVFVGSGIFKSGNPAKRAAAIVQAVTNFRDAKLIAELSEDLGEAMVGINPAEIKLIMEERGQ